MTRHITLLLIVLVAAAATPAQQLRNVAPVKWETFTDRKVKFSAAFPKLPTRDSYSDLCNEMDVTTYFAYAEEVVYKIRVFTKGKYSLSSFCSSGGSFTGTKYFDSVVAAQSSHVEKSSGGLPGIAYDGEGSKHWVFNDTGRNRVFELSIFSRDPTTVDEKRFIESFMPEADNQGDAIGDGAGQVIGDAEQVITSVTKDSAGIPVGLPLRSISKPRAAYTDRARNAKISGVVKLQVEFLANGSIGEVTPVTKLSHGLTEQAIDAARKIVFIPKKENGANVKVVATLEYSFRVY